MVKYTRRNLVSNEHWNCMKILFTFAAKENIPIFVGRARQIRISHLELNRALRNQMTFDFWIWLKNFIHSTHRDQCESAVDLTNMIFIWIWTLVYREMFLLHTYLLILNIGQLEMRVPDFGFNLCLFVCFFHLFFS